MEEILQTELLEYGKSTYLINLIKHQTGKLFISIRQTIETSNGKTEMHEIKINASVIESFTEILTQWHQHFKIKREAPKNILSAEKIEKIIHNYLKGVSIEDLSLQHNISKGIITQLLRNNDIEIITGDQLTPPENVGYFEFSNRRRRRRKRNK